MSMTTNHPTFLVDACHPVCLFQQAHTERSDEAVQMPKATQIIKTNVKTKISHMWHESAIQRDSTRRKFGQMLQVSQHKDPECHKPNSKSQEPEKSPGEFQNKTNSPTYVNFTNNMKRKKQEVEGNGGAIDG